MRLDPTTAAGIDSPIGAALALLAERDISRDIERPLLDLAQTTPPYPPAPEVVERVVEVARHRTARHTHRCPASRRCAGRSLLAVTDYAGTVEPSDVVVTAGCNQAFSLVADALAGPGDEVVTHLPYYFNHDMWLRMRGVRPVYLEPPLTAWPTPSARGAADRGPAPSALPWNTTLVAPASPRSRTNVADDVGQFAGG